MWCSESLKLSESERQTALRVPSWFFLKDREEKWAEQLIITDQPQTGNFRSEQVWDCLSHIVHNIQLYPQDEYRLICARNYTRDAWLFTSNTRNRVGGITSGLEYGVAFTKHQRADASVKENGNLGLGQPIMKSSIDSPLRKNWRSMRQTMLMITYVTLLKDPLVNRTSTEVISVREESSYGGKQMASWTPPHQRTCQHQTLILLLMSVTEAILD